MRHYYDKPDIEKALRMVLIDGITAVNVAEKMNLPPNTLYGWIAKHKAGKLGIDLNIAESRVQSQLEKNFELQAKIDVLNAEIKHLKKIIKIWID